MKCNDPTEESRKVISALLTACKFLLAEYNQHVPEDTNCPKVRQAAEAARDAIKSTNQYLEKK